MHKKRAALKSESETTRSPLSWSTSTATKQLRYEAYGSKWIPQVVYYAFLMVYLYLNIILSLYALIIDYICWTIWTCTVHRWYMTWITILYSPCGTTSYPLCFKLTLVKPLEKTWFFVMRDVKLLVPQNLKFWIFQTDSMLLRLLYSHPFFIALSRLNTGPFSNLGLGSCLRLGLRSCSSSSYGSAVLR